MSMIKDLVLPGQTNKQAWSNFMPPLRQEGERFLNNQVHWHQFSRSFRSAGQHAGFTGPQNAVALSLFQDGRILLRGRVFPHVDVHGRTDEHRGLAGQIEGAEHVRGEAVGEVGHGVGRGGGHEQKVRPLGQLDVRGNPVRLFILKGGEDGIAGDRVQGEGCNEF